MKKQKGKHKNEKADLVKKGKKQIEPVEKDHKTIDKDHYEKELCKLQLELVKMHEWIKHKGLKWIN